MSMTSGERFSIEDIALFERPVPFRMPFRFGAATLDHAPQAFVRVGIRMAGGDVVEHGASAEMMMPKWFDKNPSLSNEDNVDQLRRSLLFAREAYLSDRAPASAFAHHARHYHPLLALNARSGNEGLVAGYGPALIDRAVIDAVCRAMGLSFFAAMRRNVFGFRTLTLLPDEFAGFDDDAFVASLHAHESVDARHTVGLADAIDELIDDAGDKAFPDANKDANKHGNHGANEDGAARPFDDGLPWTLANVIRTYGHRWFKIKLGGDIDADVRRLRSIAAVLRRLSPDCRITLDGNEQFRDIAHVEAAWSAFRGDPALREMLLRVEWIEQPIARSRALSAPVTAHGSPPLMIDESDGDLDSFPSALALGYRGVSSKSCKGLYKSLINLARVRRWNASHPGDPAFISGEDLTMQAGIAVQQDLALVSLLGIDHVERNGHHYVDGMQGAPAHEQRSFVHAHPDLYTSSDGHARLAIRNGSLSLRSLDCVGFACAAEIDWDAMTPMPDVSSNAAYSASSAAAATITPATALHPH